MFYNVKKYFQWSNLYIMIKRIVQKIKTKKNGEIGEIFGRPDGKKSSVRAFARTRAKKNIEKQIKRDKLELFR